MSNSPATSLPPARRLSGMIAGLWVPQAIHAAAELGIADALAAEPLSGRDVAARVGADPDATERLLRALVVLEVCTDEGGRFGLTPLGRALRSDAPDSMRSVSRLMSGPDVWSAWSRLVDCVRTGRAARALDRGDATGTEHFDELVAEPRAAAIFHQAMVEWTRMAAPGIAGAIDLREARRVVDLGGGYGELLCAILEAHPHTTGCVFDLEHARAGALALFAARGLAGRASFAVGDLFGSPLPAADALVMKSVIHDWDDDRSLRILRRCRDAMESASRLFLVEPAAGRRDPALDWVLAFSDLNMLVNTGGRERTEAEYRALLEAARLRVLSVRPASGSFFSVFEAARA